MTKWMRILMVLALAVMLAFTGVACSNNDGPAEEAGEAIDDAIDDAGDALEDAGDAIQDRADELRDN
jgi:hypothetical protein